MDSFYGGMTRPDPFTSSDWAAGTRTNALGEWGGGSNTYQSSAPYAYDSMSRGGVSYDPAMGIYGSFYDPSSGFTSQVISEQTNRWLQDKYKYLFDFDSGNVNSGGGGNVSQNPNFGQFGKDPAVYGEIEAAANKYGVPANLLKSMLAREGSGDWSGQNTQATWMSSRGYRIVGYSGITEPAATAWGYNFDDLVGNRALQIDAMANGLRRLFGSYGAQYGWDGVISAYYSGDPSQTYTPADSYQYGQTAQYVRDINTWWRQEDEWTRANGGTVGSGGGSALGSIDSNEWSRYNAQNGLYSSVATQYGVQPNLVKSLYKALDGTGADPKQALDSIRQEFNRVGSWETATKQYAFQNKMDANKFWAAVNGGWRDLDASINSSFGGEGKDAGPVTSIESIWGNMPDVYITQRNGEVNGWTTGAGAGYYDYSTGVLGYANAHPGNDYGMGYGSKIFTPVSGTVILAGGSGYYRDESQADRPYIGELRIRLDNGDELILGHMSGIHVDAGARVNAGQYVGLSGTAGSGAHLHVEYRTPDSSMGSGWRSVDPEEALRGVFGGSFSGNMTGVGIDRPMTYSDMLLAGAKGQPLRGGNTLGSDSSWNAWLRKAMFK